MQSSTALMEVAEPTDAELLRQYRETGSEAAFATLVARYRGLVTGVAERVLADRPDAEDAAQAAFVALAFKPPVLGRDGRLGGWLHRVAVRSALDFRKSALRRTAREAVAVAGSPPPAAVPVDLDLALEKLPRKLSGALIGHYLEGWSLDELAARENCPASTISMRLSRGRRLLRERLRMEVAFPAIAGAGPFAGHSEPPASTLAASALQIAKSLARNSLPESGRAVAVARVAKGAAIGSPGLAGIPILSALTASPVSTPLAVVAAVLLTGLAGTGAFQAWRDRGFTPWMEQPRLDAHLASLSANFPPGSPNYWDRGHCIHAVEGRLHRGVMQYRVRYGASPAGAFWWYWFIDMTPEEFAAHDGRLSADGYTRVYENSFLLADGERRFQAVWQKTR